MYCKKNFTKVWVSNPKDAWQPLKICHCCEASIGVIYKYADIRYPNLISTKCYNNNSSSIGHCAAEV